MITVHLPQDLAADLHCESTLTIDGGGTTLDRLLLELEAMAPGIAQKVLDDHGDVRPHLHLYVSGRRVEPRSLTCESVVSGDEVWLLRSVSGG